MVLYYLIRMPLILAQDMESVWLDQNVAWSREIHSMLSPFPEEQMVAYEVSQLVNSPCNDVPECIVSVSRLF